MTQAREMLFQAELAMGCPRAVMRQWQFLRRMGWHHHITPESIVTLAVRHPSVKAMIWC